MRAGSGRRAAWAVLGTALAVLALMLLTACAGDSTTFPTPLAPSTAMPTARPTFTAVPAPTITATATVILPTSTPEPTPTPTRADNISPLTGMQVDPALIHRRVLAFRVGNDPVIRPQEGLGAADIVYEEIMDGWTVTRFTALFLESEAERVRPLRSARLSSLAIAPQYDAALVHTGASDPIRFLLSQSTIVDLDQYFHEAPYGVLAGYDWRGRMYSSTGAVREYLQESGLESDKLIDGYVFDEQAPTGASGTTVNIPYPAGTVDWTYDAASGLYLRKTNGVAHTDALTGDQIAAANVVLFITEHGKTDIVEDTNGATAIDIVMTGTGSAIVLRDGVQLAVEWRRLADDKVILYYDAEGGLVPLKPGKTWIELMPPDYDVTVG